MSIKVYNVTITVNGVTATVPVIRPSEIPGQMQRALRMVRPLVDVRKAI